MKQVPEHVRQRRLRRQRRLKIMVRVANLCSFLLGVFLMGAVIFLFRANAKDVIPPDRTPPQLYGVQDITIYLGETVAYRSGILVADDTDPAPSLTVDSSGVDLSKVGSYPITYLAVDASGNQTQQTATVTVLDVTIDMQTLQTIYEAADRQLEAIVNDTMSTRQKVAAIYAWARANLQYAGHSDRTDWRQTAYTMLTEKKGDCFGFFAVTKLLLERLEIPNIDVRKVKNREDDSDHFWSLVSIDGGRNYYHFDATPRVGEGDNFCLVTDAFLDAYSSSHGRCHNRDMSLYPATPTEDLP